MARGPLKFIGSLSEWSTERRIETAKERTRLLTDRILDVIELASNCEYFVYKDDLTKQIPASYAGNAYMSVQDALFRQLVVRTVALWDKPDFEVVSIPTIVEFIDDPAVIHELQHEHYDAHADQGYRNLNPSKDADLERAVQVFFRASQRNFAADQAQKAHHHLAICIESVRDIEREQIITPVRNLRDHTSHSLIRTRREIVAPVPNMTYGEERSLREKSIAIIQDLYCWVNGTSFDISGDCVDRANRNAKDLWERCRFKFK